MPATRSRLRRRREVRDRAADRLLQRMVVVEIARPSAVRIGRSTPACRCACRSSCSRAANRAAAAALRRGTRRSPARACRTAGPSAVLPALGAASRPRRPRGAARRNGSRRAARPRGCEKPKRSSAAAGDERHRLERLQRASRHRQECRIAGARRAACPSRSTTAIDPMCTLSTRVAAHDDGERRVAGRARARRQARGARGDESDGSGRAPRSQRRLSPDYRRCPAPTARHRQADSSAALQRSTSERRPDLLERRRILDRREVAGIAAFGERLDRAPQQLAGARLRQQRDEMHGAGSRDRAELAGRRWPSPPCASAPRLPAVATFDGILDDRERDRNLALERIGDADDRHLRRFPDAPARPPRSRACRADGRRR